MHSVVKKLTTIFGLAALILWTFLGYKYVQGDFRFFLVQSGSMEPALSVGSVIVTKPQESFVQGDILTFNTAQGKVVTHRIAEVIERDGIAFYQTKGDANNSSDADLVTQTMILGKVASTIPYVGRIIVFSKTLPGYIGFVLLPAFYLLIQGVRKFRQAFKVMTQNEVIALVFIAGALLHSIGNTAAYFNAVSNSSPVTFSTAESFQSELADHLVINEVLYDTNQDQTITGGQGGVNRGEWAEIYNPTASSVNLTGWILSDGNEAETLTGTIPAGGFLIVTGATEAEFEAVWTVPSSLIYKQADGGKIGNGLAKGGGKLVLLNGATIIDSMSWGTDTTGFSAGCTSSCPVTSTGQSFERNPAGVDTNTATNFSIQSSPSPGVAGF